MSDIAPCPCCRGKARLSDDANGSAVECETWNCPMVGTVSSGGKGAAIAAWNRLSAAATLANAARAWLAEVERVDPPPADQCVLGGVTVGLIRATGEAL